MLDGFNPETESLAVLTYLRGSTKHRLDSPIRPEMPPLRIVAETHQRVAVVNS